MRRSISPVDRTLCRVSSTSSLALFFWVVLVFTSHVELSAQGSITRKASSVPGVLKVQVPSGVLGDNYWVYVNDRLRGSPPHGTVVQHKLNIIFLADGSGDWEGWNDQGIAVSSKRLDQYLRSGDPYGIFRSIEYRVPAGSYIVEIMVPGPRPGTFLISRKSGVLVQAGRPSEVFTSVPPGFTLMPPFPSPAQAVGYALCLPSPAKFDLDASTDRLLKWGEAYRNDPLRQSLLRATTTYRPGDSFVTMNVDLGPKEYDGQQINIMLQRFYGPPFGRGDIEHCRKLLPQYSEAFNAFETTIENVLRDQEKFKKLAGDLAAARRER